MSALVPGIAAIAAAAAAEAGAPIVQLGYFATGYDEFGVPLEIPSIDPAGVAYHDPSGHLFIADSEINEVNAVFDLIEANVFEASLDGETLHASYDLTLLGNNEPTGIAYNVFDGHFYVSNDDAMTITRYGFSPGSGFEFDDVVSTLASAGMDDPEGVTCDPATGLLYAVDGGSESIMVYSYDEGAAGFTLHDILDLKDLNQPSEVPADPEGIAFESGTGHLFVVSDPDDAMFEYTPAGIFVARYDLTGLEPPIVAPQGLTFAPTSASGDDPLTQGLYLTDGMIDNNQDPEERDGAVYEVRAGTDPCGNGAVDPGEDCANCPADVPCPPGEECIGSGCVALCGNGVVDPGEDCANCPADVACPPGTECIDGMCELLCGNGVVDPGEDCANCPADVACPPGTECADGMCERLCGNGVVDPGEDCANCPIDMSCPPGTECIAGLCVPLCGNGVVDPGEDCASCPDDVPCPHGTACDAGVCTPACAADLDGDGIVDVVDALLLLGLWGSDPGGPPDFDGSGVVDVADFLVLLEAWGPCP